MKRALRDIAVRVALNPEVQVVALPLYQAFRRADMHNNNLEETSGVELSAQEHI